MSLQPADSHARTIVNACLMRSTHAVELSRALSERGDAYLDALLHWDAPRHRKLV